MPLTPTRKLKRGVTVGNSLALVTDSSGRAATGATTAAEIGYLAGVTSAVQTQLDARLPLAGGTMTGQLNFSGTTHAGIKLISLTTTQRDALTAANGMLIYNTTNARVEQYTGGAWAAVSSSSFALYVENPSSATAPTAAGSNAMALGDSSSSAGDYGFAAGFSAAASGRRTLALGSSTIASAAFASAFSDASSADNVGQATFLSASGGGGADQIQERQAYTLFQLASRTTGSSPTEINCSIADGATYTGRPLIPNNSTAQFTINVTARRTDADGENDAWEFKGLIHRDANAASTTLDSLQVNQIGPTGWGCSVTADTTNGGLLVTVTGESAKTIRWVGVVHMHRNAE